MFDLDEFLKSTSSFDVLETSDFAKTGGMYTPSLGDRHIDSALTNISLAFVQSAEGFVAERTFRTVDVNHKSDVFWEYPRGEFNLNLMEERAPGAESAGAGYNVNELPYNCKVYALHTPIPDQIRSNADSAFNLDRDAVQFLTQKSLIHREVKWATDYFASGQTPGQVWTFVGDGIAGVTTATDFTGAGTNDVQQWDQATSKPIEIVRTAIRTVQQETGFRPNIMTMGRAVFDVLVDHPDIIGRIDSGQTPNGPAMASKQLLAALFEVDEILVMDAIVNSAKFGLPAQHAFIGGKNALLCYRPSSPGLMTPAAGYTFNWTGFVGANEAGGRIKNFRVESRESDIIEIQSSFDQHKVASDLGFFFNGIVS